MRHPSRDEGLLLWQWSRYPGAHRDRANLLAHALTVPFFVAGTVVLLASPFLGPWWLGEGGLAAMVAAVMFQGRTHRRERTAAAPFRGPADVLQRILLEQWVTFPRFVLSGEFSRSWRSSPREPSEAGPDPVTPA